MRGPVASPASPHRLILAIAAAGLLGVAPAPAAAGGSDAATARQPQSSLRLPGDPSEPTRRLASTARVVYATPVRTEPGGGKRIGTLSASTRWGGSTTLLVRGSRRVAGELWLNVYLDRRPNGTHGWIPADHAQVSSTSYRVEIIRAKRELRVLRSGKVIRRARVVVGKRGTPTPAGTFAITDAIRYTPGRGFLGSWALPLTAYSAQLQEFDGGPGQVALHGRGGSSFKDPLGSASSHGCVRMNNADIAFIAARAPAGTPVVIR